MTLYANLHICSLIPPSCHVKGDTSSEWHPYVSICWIVYFNSIFLMWLNGRKESWKYYHIYLLWQLTGRCGLGGHVFGVYALYLSLINALLLSAVIHTREQRWGLTQRASGFLLWFQGLKGLGSASSGLCGSGAGRCSKKIHTKTKGCQSVFLLLMHSSFGIPLLLSTAHFETKGSSKLCFSARQLLRSFFQMKACDSDAEQSQGSERGLPDLLLCGSSLSPIFAIGLLFSGDLFNDKWRVTNLTIMLFVFPEKWNDIIS